MSDPPARISWALVVLFVIGVDSTPKEGSPNGWLEPPPDVKVSAVSIHPSYCAQKGSRSNAIYADDAEMFCDRAKHNHYRLTCL
ncbi:hypothetical protein V5799_008030 [Amblyomma americanum]|uniref:Secreted protein n=1 Tax=Amblyomma americanum TaxID=6943 RepID=A0AAQ4FEF3_AMBAM